MSIGIVKQGYLSVKEDGLMNFLWTKRYVVLRDQSLSFYKSEGSTQPVIVVFLSSISGVSRVETKPYCFEVESKDKSVLISCKSDDDVYAWMDEIYNRSPLTGVSNPTNFQHKVHVGFDSNSGLFTGLPEAWRQLLSQSAISKEEMARNPQAVLDVLEFYTGTKRPDLFGLSAAAASSSTATVSHNHSNYTSNESRHFEGKPPGTKQRTTSMGAQPPSILPLRSSAISRSDSKYSIHDADTLRRPDPETSRRLENESQRRLDAERCPDADTLRRNDTDGIRRHDRESFRRHEPEVSRRHEPEASRRQEEPYRRHEPEPIRVHEREPARQHSEPEINNAPHTRYTPAPPARPPVLPRPIEAPTRPQPPKLNLATPPASPHRQPPAVAAHQVQLIQKLPTGPPVLVQKHKLPAPATTAAAPVGEQKKPRKPGRMTTGQVLELLRGVVSGEDPTVYVKQKKIGQGASGSVYLARHAISQRVVAIKQMDLAAQPRPESIVNEIIVMKESQHPNIVNYLDSFLVKQELWVVMELMEGGPLNEIIDANNGTMTEAQISAITFETLKGLHHLHNKNIIHRDIKSDNVLMNASGQVKVR
jgi:protein-serine/threonine kinase